MLVIQFDAIEHVQKMRQVGMPQEQAEAQAQALERIVTQQTYIVEKQQIMFQEQKAEIAALHSKELATKGDLEQLRLANKSDLEQLRLANKSDLAAVKSDLELKIEQLRSDTKHDFKEVELKIERLRYDSLKFIIWTGVAIVVTLVGTLGGMIGKGFHWW